MRLIDADKLIEKCRKGWKLFGREDEKLKHWVDEDDIRNQPTVKAIPVEWIKKWALDHYPFTAPTLTVEVFKHMEVMRMIEDWGKENDGKETD